MDNRIGDWARTYQNEPQTGSLLQPFMPRAIRETGDHAHFRNRAMVRSQRTSQQSSWVPRESLLPESDGIKLTTRAIGSTMAGMPLSMSEFAGEGVKGRRRKVLCCIFDDVVERKEWTWKLERRSVPRARSTSPAKGLADLTYSLP